MVMSVLEIVIISAGLSLDVFVAMAYMGAGFSKINKKNLFGLCLLFGGVQWGCLIVGNLLILLPIFRDSSNSSSRIADHWEAVTVLIFIGLGIYMIWKGLKKRNKCRCISCGNWNGVFGSANDPPVTDDFPNYSTECNWWCICRI